MTPLTKEQHKKIMDKMLGPLDANPSAFARASNKLIKSLMQQSIDRNKRMKKALGISV